MLKSSMTIFAKSLIFSLISIAMMYCARIIFHSDLYLTDIGGLGAFLTVFGTLYGIMTAFVVFEVWNQYNRTSELIDKEALGLERLFRLTLYFRDKKLTGSMKRAIKNYVDLVVENNFQAMAKGERNIKSGKAFRKIAEVIKSINFDDDHDQVVFGHVISHYGHVSEMRTARITQSLARMPLLLKMFLYSTSLIALATFIVMPFASVGYGFLATGALSFVLGMVTQLVEDLDNPFVGHWNVTPKPFTLALKHINEDYE